MKSETRVVYVARDGKEFRTSALCLAHEREYAGEHLVGLTAKQVAAARTGADPELAEIFKMFVAGMRRAGALKRQERATEISGDKQATALPKTDGADRAPDSAPRTETEQAPNEAPNG
jgi:hypothetical protein